MISPCSCLLGVRRYCQVFSRSFQGVFVAYETSTLRSKMRHAFRGIPEHFKSHPKSSQSPEFIRCLFGREKEQLGQENPAFDRRLAQFGRMGLESSKMSLPDRHAGEPTGPFGRILTIRANGNGIRANALIFHQHSLRSLWKPRIQHIRANGFGFGRVPPCIRPNGPVFTAELSFRQVKLVGFF